MADLLRQGGIVLVLAVMCYGCAYYSLVEPDPCAIVYIRFGVRGARVETPVSPQYAYVGESAESFFFPMHRVDRWLRPQVWFIRN